VITAPNIVPRFVLRGSQHDLYAHRWRLLLLVVLPPAGAVLIVLAFHHAASRIEPDHTQFVLFWAGFLGGMLPLVVLACSSRIDGVVRTAALAGIGLLGNIRGLRLPAGPMANDEFAHMRQVLETFLHGDIGHASKLLPVTEYFPGMHQVIAAFARLTGAPLWPAALAVVALAHVLSVLAVYQLLRAVGASPKGGAVGAVVYSFNPSWATFDTSVSYESLALPLLLWCLAAVISASREAPKQPSLRYIAVVALAAAALPMIHHLSTIILCLILTLLILAGVVHLVRRLVAKDRGAPREHLWPLLVALAFLLASITYWWSKIRQTLIDYLSPALTRGWAQLSQLGDLASASVSGARTPFSSSQNPIYETVCGLLFPPVVLAMFLTSLVVLWVNRRHLGSAAWGFAALGAMYFLSLPMVLTRGGAEGAHRSWGFSFIGIAVVCGLAWTFGLSSVVEQFGRLGRGIARFQRPGVRIGVISFVLIVMYLGGAATGTNVSSRFPGGTFVGDDTRSVSREGAAVAEWMAARVPVDTAVIADRWVGQQVGWVGRMAPLSPSASFPLWDFYMSAEPVRPEVVKQVLDAKVRYFVVDARMSTTHPRMGFWFTGDEPGANSNRLYPQVAIDRFECLPWLHASYAAGPLTVYEVDADVLRRTMADDLRRTTAGSCEDRVA